MEHESSELIPPSPDGERSYTELKVLGDGSFGTVWLCDWHSPVKPGLLLSAMQSGAGARPEWAGKRLVALKRMKRVWEGGWTEARNLGEIYVGVIMIKSIMPVLTLSVPESDTSTPSDHPFIRRIHLPQIQRALLCLRMYGRQSLSTHQISSWSTPRGWSDSQLLPSNHLWTPPHTSLWLLSPGYETRKPPRDYHRPGRLSHRFDASINQLCA